MALKKIETWIPGLRLIRGYRREWFRSDLVAGLSVAAVALPIGIAYAQLAGFSPVVGIYSCILPPVAYALFGSSRQLILNPDAATCAIVASTIAPLALGNALRYADLSIVLAGLTGILCILGGIAGLGVIANFLSRPILTGYLNGIALSIMVGQLGTLLGYSIPSAGFFRTLGHALTRLGQTHWVSLGVGLGLFVLLRLLKRLSPKIPAPLIAAALGIAVVSLLGLEGRGLAVVGTVPAGFPMPRFPSPEASDWGPLFFGACGIVLVSFCSMMTTARGFAAKNSYPIDPNRDMIALGVADLASGFSQGFVVSGADSRTAVADASGGKTQVTSLVAAAAMTLVLFFLTAPLALLPKVALAAILISSAMSLFDIESLRRYFRVSRVEFYLSIIAMLGVMTVGVLQGVLIALGLTFIKFLSIASRPPGALLGLARDEQGLYGAELEKGGEGVPGLIIYRLDSSLLFFNADYFKDRVLHHIRQTQPEPKWFLLDAESVPAMDVTGADVLEELRLELVGRGIQLTVARAKGLFLKGLEKSGLAERIGPQHLFPTIRAGAAAYLSLQERAAKT